MVMKTKKIGILMVFLVATQITTQTGKSKERKWTSRDGTHSVIATLVEHDDSSVKLKRSDTGKVVIVLFEKLSPEDVAYVKRLETVAPASPDEPATANHGDATTGKKATSPFEPLSTDMSEVRVSDGWKTSERLLLAADSNRVGDGTVWVNTDGTFVAFIETKDEKERMVINGRAEAWYDDVTPASFSPYTVFFGRGEHYAYTASRGDIAEDKEMSSIVIVGNPDELFG